MRRRCHVRVRFHDGAVGADEIRDAARDGRASVGCGADRDGERAVDVGEQAKWEALLADERRVVGGLIEGDAANHAARAAIATPFLPPDFTRYMAVSVVRKSPSASLACNGDVATPMLAVSTEMSTSA